jgi:signal transduction histidine kinase
MSINDKSKKRVEDLFTGMTQLISEASNGHDHPVYPISEGGTPHENGSQIYDPTLLLQEMETLRTRVYELEARLEAKKAEEKQEEDPKAASAPIIYEKEQVGFAFVGDKVLPVRGNQQPVQNDAEVIKTPLVFSGKAMGEVQITKPSERPLTDEDIKMANAIAQQASIQIENLRLLAEAERARAEAEEATHQFTHKNWSNFLDAIHNAERIGYAYDQEAVEPFEATEPREYDHAEIMETLDEQIGRLFVKGNGALTAEDKKFINTVAKQVSQQVENIRLLADASRARAEAEEATRRLTKQNWETYTERDEGVLGFVYDSVKVSPMSEEVNSSDVVIEQPLYVRGQEIGQLAVKGLKNVPPEAKEMAAAIAAQTSIHLEALRLTEELQKRAQELKELDRLKSAFLANMSHELRTPLNSILGFTDVMLEGLDGPLTDYMDNDLRLIQKNGQHLLHLINDVLDMAKIESGRMNLHPEKFRVQGLLEEVTSITSTMASEKNVSLFIDPASDSEIEIYADNTRIRQVMINLVNNSIKFTEQGKIALKVVPLDGARVHITVQDTGLGIPPDKLEAIFQEFTQVDTSTTRKVGGTGLGLPISRRLVEMHGGRLWAESTGIDGEGSTFHVELPLEARITEVIEKKEK